MYKILVYGMSTNPGGIESVIINYFRHIDNTKIHFDFIAETPEKIANEEEIINKGSRVYHIARRRTNPVKYYLDMKTLFRNKANRYDCFWYNVNSLENIYAVKMAKKYGIKKIIVHSHNSKNMFKNIGGIIKYRIHIFHKNNIFKYATDYWACSYEAGKWLFPQRVLDKLVIIKNAINVKGTAYSAEKRREFREKYNIKSNFVLGNVGRLHFQKNQIFLLNILKKIRKDIPNVKLVLVGDGPDKELLQKKVKEFNLERNIVFCGIQRDMQACYSGFDLFLFPSLFEGISIALLEAQANGLPIIASKNVNPKEIAINGNIIFKDLYSVNDWVNSIKKIYNTHTRLEIDEINNNFVNSGYAINIAAKELSDKFLENN